MNLAFVCSKSISDKGEMKHTHPPTQALVCFGGSCGDIVGISKCTHLRTFIFADAVYMLCQNV